MVCKTSDIYLNSLQSATRIHVASYMWYTISSYAIQLQLSSTGHYAVQSLITT